MVHEETLGRGKEKAKQKKTWEPPRKSIIRSGHHVNSIRAAMLYRIFQQYILSTSCRMNVNAYCSTYRGQVHNTPGGPGKKKVKNSKETHQGAPPSFERFFHFNLTAYIQILLWGTFVLNVFTLYDVRYVCCYRVIRCSWHWRLD